MAVSAPCHERSGISGGEALMSIKAAHAVALSNADQGRVGNGRQPRNGAAHPDLVGASRAAPFAAGGTGLAETYSIASRVRISFGVFWCRCVCVGRALQRPA